VAVLRTVKRSAGYRMLRSRLLTVHPTDLWPDEASRLTLVAFALRPDGAEGRPGIAVFAVDVADTMVVSARVAEFGDEGTVSEVHTLTPVMTGLTPP
jgi:hypothetical protein